MWDYIYMGGDMPAASPIPVEDLQRMRREFEFWYPFDLRVSGKDLIQARLGSAAAGCVVEGRRGPARIPTAAHTDCTCPPPAPICTA